MKTVTSPSRPSAQRMRFLVYEDNTQRWRWRIVSQRGDVLAESNKSYGRHQAAVQAVDGIQKSAAGAKLDAKL